MNVQFNPQKIGTALVFDYQFPGGTSSRTLLLRLVTPSGIALANQTGIKWAFFDQSSPDMLLAPVAKGSGATTDASANLGLSIATSKLPPNGVGYLTISNTDGTITGPSTAFSATVQLP